MNMSKNQIVLLGCGGVTLLCAAVLGYLAFDAYSSKAEAAETLEGAKSTIQRLLHAEISPDNSSVLALNKNRDTVSGWSEAALSTMSAGDRAIRDDVNAAAFKQQLMDEARVMSNLPGGVDGVIVKPDFAFGFAGYITGGEIPVKEKLPQLQRQWGDIRFLVETLAECGVVEIVRIEPSASAAAKSATDEAAQEAKPKKSKKRAKGAEEEKPAYTCEDYAVDFRAKPAALVKAVNALATAGRFVVVKSFDFVREGDMIAAALGEGEKNSASQPTSSRRRRRGQAAEEAAPAAAEEDQSKKGLVNDPANEGPFLVKMVVSTYDFGSAAKAPAEEAAEPVAAEESAKEGEE